jgi:hypothetical protein
MWNDVIIGKPSQACSAWSVLAIEGTHSISENKYDYWITTDFLHIGMKIAKDTAIGKKLSKMINDKVKKDKILQYLDGIALKRIHPTTLRNKIENALKGAYSNGREDLQADFRKLLRL